MSDDPWAQRYLRKAMEDRLDVSNPLHCNGVLSHSVGQTMESLSLLDEGMLLGVCGNAIASTMLEDAKCAERQRTLCVTVGGFLGWPTGGGPGSPPL